MSECALIEARNLVPLIEGEVPPSITCSISEGSVTCILGAEFYRTAYIRALGGVDQPASGDLRLLGLDASELPEKVWRSQRRRIGFVGRTAPLLSVINGVRNVMLPVLYHRIGTTEEAESHAWELINALNYEANHELLPAYMSELQRKHLAIARALMLEPKVLFVSEPFSNLEIEERNLIEDYLLRVAHQDKHALVVASNDLIFAKRSVDHLIFADKKSVAQYDSWDTFLNSTNPAIQRFLELQRHSFCVFDN